MKQISLFFLFFFISINAFSQGIRNLENDQLDPDIKDEERFNWDNKIYRL
jgi:hypothetical protein